MKKNKIIMEGARTPPPISSFEVKKRKENQIIEFF